MNIVQQLSSSSSVSIAIATCGLLFLQTFFLALLDANPDKKSIHIKTSMFSKSIW